MFEGEQVVYVPVIYINNPTVLSLANSEAALYGKGACLIR